MGKKKRHEDIWPQKLLLKSPHSEICFVSKHFRQRLFVFSLYDSRRVNTYPLTNKGDQRFKPYKELGVIHDVFREVVGVLWQGYDGQRFDFF